MTIIQDVQAAGDLRRHLSTAAYMVISVLGGMAILIFAFAMGYQVMQLIYTLL